MKKTLRTLVFVLLLLLAASLCFGGCGKDGGKELSAPDYRTLELGDYVRLGEYKNLTVDAKDKGLAPDVALWDTVVANAEIIKYPEAAISYYKKQAELRYKYHAEEGNMSYDELLSSLGITEADIENEAKKYVKSDLVRVAIIQAEGLHLTDDEKTRLFDKYAYKFSTTYGYTDEYVRENLADEIYDAMQYDKMMEFLLLNNEVTENYTEEE